MNILNTYLLDIDQDPNTTNIDNCLMVTKKAQRESYESACNIPTPAPTKTHMPVPNHNFINLTAEHIRNIGWDITTTTYASSFDQGNCHFVFELSNRIYPGITMQIAGHNSHIKMRSAILYLQTRTRACTNMDVPCEIPLQRKHTSKILEQLSFLIAGALGKLHEAARKHTDRVYMYKECTINDIDAHDIMIRAVENEAIPTTYLPQIIQEWRSPAHQEFEERNLYSLYNCFTESYKRSPAETPKRTQRLLEMLDANITLDESYPSNI